MTAKTEITEPMLRKYSVLFLTHHGTQCNIHIFAFNPTDAIEYVKLNGVGFQGCSTCGGHRIFAKEILRAELVS